MMENKTFLNCHLSMIAKEGIGIREQNAEKGQLRREFSELLEIAADDKPWCLAFVHFCIKMAEMEFKTISDEEEKVPIKIFLSDNCLTTWEHSPDQQTLKPVVGSLCIWQKFDGAQPLNDGHVGVVVELHENGTISVVEGNTRNLNSSDETGCDGVNFFLYKTEKMDRGALKFKGFLNVW